MALLGIRKPKAFFAALAKCKGDVELQTSEGDRLNLRSTLCQYLALTQMFAEGKMESIELLLSEPDDLAVLAPYLVLSQK